MNQKPLNEFEDAAGAAEAEGTESAAPGVDALPGGLEAALEALLMIAEEPLDELRLASALGRTTDEIGSALVGLQREYDGYTSEGSEQTQRVRGFDLRRSAGGWRIYSRADFAPIVRGFILEGQSSRLSQAALETLAVIAYRQPVSRARVSAVRGVNVDSVVRTLLSRGLIDEMGSDPHTGAVLYGTTKYFLERLGLNSLEELPEIAPLLPSVEEAGGFTDDYNR